MTYPAYLKGVDAACWRRAERRRFAHHPRRHAELVVLHGLVGRMRYLIDGRVVTLSAGSLLFAFSGQAHVLLSETPDFDMWVVVVSERLLGATAGSADLPPLHGSADATPTHPRVLSANRSRELAAIAAGLAEQEADAGPAVADGYRWWLARAWHLFREAPASRADRVHPAVDRAAQALQADPSLTVGELALQAGLSAGRLGRLFRRQTGKSLVKFRNETRLARVDRALAEAPYGNLLNAALDAGFGGYPQFYRAFRALRGAAPFDYYRRSKSPGITS